MKFALITEGASEHRIIKHIISKYFRDQETDINQIQPRIIDGKQEASGGWNEVLKYCQREELKDILIENDYLIIQIDSDQSQTKPFNVSHTKENGKVKTSEELHNDIINKLSELLLPEIKQTHGDKIFFAICIHTIECWLLPLYFTNNHKTVTSNCLSRLNSELAKKNIPVIPQAKNSPNGVRAYDILLKNFRRKEEINNAAKHNIGFKKFITSISVIND